LRSDKNKPHLLATIIEEENGLYFASMTQAGEWTKGDAVPDHFPVKRFSSTGYERLGYEYLMLAGGRDTDEQLLNTAWATSNALQWVLFTREDVSNFGKKEGAMLAKYDDKLFLAGGIGEEGVASKDIYLSIDNGISWALQDSMIIFPSEYSGRGYASIEVDSNNYMYIFGGKSGKSAKHTDEIWRGRINRLGFGQKN
jgi:hypothetical protein